MKNVCIVGWGAIGPIHAAGIEKTENANFYAVCDVDYERIKDCRKKYQVSEYTKFDIMLRDEKIDSIHICTPHYLHYEMIEKALAAGKSVVCEKPAVMTAEELYKLSHLPGSDKVCFVIQNRLNDSIVKMKELLDSGDLGRIISAKGILTWWRDEAYYNSGEWRGKWATEGGGVLINQAIHTLDLMIYLSGKVNSVKADMNNYSLENVIEVEDTVSAYLRFEAGHKGIFFATNAFEGGSDPHVEFVCEKGRVCYMNNKLYLNGVTLETDSKPTVGKDYWGNSHEVLVKRYYDGGEYFSLNDIKNTMKTMFAIYESAKNGGTEINI